ncbi:MAG: HAMP domain-containing sensor histidine kinase [Pseudomonadota bacterium]
MLATLRQSLTARLLLVFVITSVVIAVLLVGSLFNAVRSQWRYTIAPHIEQYLDYVNEDLGYPPSQQRAQELSQKLRINIYIDGPDTRFSTTGSPLDTSDIEFRDRPQRLRKYKQQNNALANIQIGEHDDRTVLKNQTGEYSVYYELRHRHQHNRHRNGFWFPIVLLLTILGACYWLLRRMLRPVQDIKKAVQSMGAGHLDTRVPVRSGNDLGVLAGSINTMASDIEKLLDAKRQLLLGASHELRTPVTRAKIAAQMLDKSTNQARIVEDLDEMESLIADIMESERVTGGHAALNLTQVNAAELTEAVLSELHCQDSVTTQFAADLPALQADATRLRLLLRNLISNALKHGESDQPPQVTIKADNTAIHIAVSDYGGGIEAEHLARLTEPFYRADPSRARATGGFGLGLHISDLIVQAHGGTMAFDSTVGQGTTVRVVLPLNSQR